ncbi:hypothetical protein chiPu_0001392 [Chiloscyllium punctatum]|uniref:Peptide-N-glycosidase F N-terminal domain-containing protein n=1 Tax=Chiloscyllium punctatum TaxID=137246 RepID=A0A401RXX0_CHIPU|nr:hypothetical protein [Chiloscyllium punctatum]
MARGLRAMAGAWGPLQLLLLSLALPGSESRARWPPADCPGCERLWKVKEHTVYGHDSGLAMLRVNAEEFGSGAGAGAEAPHEADSRLGLMPGMAAPPFSLDTLDGRLSYPAVPERPDRSFIFQAFTNKSGFLECLWSSPASLVALVDGLPPHTHLVFMSFDDSAPRDVRWMKQQLIPVMEARLKNISRFKDFLSQLHFVPIPVYALGNWIPAIFYAWRCQQHNCGLAQIVFTSAELNMTVVAKRLDARYDWIMKGWSSLPYILRDGGDGCNISSRVKNAVAFISDEGNCSYFTKVNNMANSEALGVLVYVRLGRPLQDMNCRREECLTIINIPASIMHYQKDVIEALRNHAKVNVTFQHTPSPNFYFGIDKEGKLSESGWFLYPSFNFIVWQAQWFIYMKILNTKLQRPATIKNVFNDTVMQGDKGAVATVELPEDLYSYDHLELDASLSCPGTKDETCPHWDHTVQLYVCCMHSSSFCNLELGRWITPFRRRIGRWLTDVSPLLPLINTKQCTFTMKTAPWAMPWKPSLNLRFSKRSQSSSGYRSSLHPFKLLQLFTGGIFDKNYNKKYHPIKFVVPSSTKKVELYAVITGHGSDENGCGEFCVTSHHFVINGIFNNTRTFDDAGMPLGCANQVLNGVVPNEHGTWLYGRNGWCDGQDVAPWRKDVTKQVNMAGTNSIIYFGWFKGKDPNPKKNPGEITMYSYLVFYK